MRVAFEHRTTRAAARARIDAAIPRALTLVLGQLKDVAYEWEGDTLRFSLRALGFPVAGTVDVTDTEVIVDVGLPRILRPLEGRVKSRVLGELRDFLA